jgi:hypothetical protein
VDLLVEKNVIVNWLGNNAEVKTLIKKLGHEIMEVKYCYNHLTKQLNLHCGNSWNCHMASLKAVCISQIFGEAQPL